MVRVVFQDSCASGERSFRDDGSGTYSGGGAFHVGFEMRYSWSFTVYCGAFPDTDHKSCTPFAPYGYAGGGETAPFEAEFTNRVILKLGQATVQYAEYSWTNLDGRLMAPNMAVDVMENQGYAPPAYTDMHVVLGSERDMPGGTYVYRTSHTEQGSLTPTVNGRSYHITVGANSFFDLEANHRFFVGETGAGHRWVCYGVCEFPGGEEAPILTR